MTAFMMTGAVMDEFFRRCAEREAITEKEKFAVLLELAKEGKMKSVTVTRRSKEQYIEDLAKNFGTIMVVKKKQPEISNEDRNQD